MCIKETDLSMYIFSLQDAPIAPAPFDLDPGGGLGKGDGGGILAVRSCPNFSFKLPEDDDNDKAQNCQEKSPMIV